MTLSFDSKTAVRADEVLVRFFAKEERDELPVHVPEAEWSAAANAALFLHSERLLCVGLGPAGNVTRQTLRAAAGTAARFLTKNHRSKLALDLVRRPEWTDAAVEGALLGAYRFETFKVQRTPALESLRCIVGAPNVANAKRLGKRAEFIAGVTNIARDLGNQPGNVIFPESLADEIHRLTRRTTLRLTVLDEKKLRAKKFGGILAVGAGSARPPRLIILEHRGGKPGERPLALVGKAITFDTGGISIKPAAGMQQMIFDKSGGMAVLGAMLGIAGLRLKRNVIGLIAAAENMPGATAYRPGDVITMYDGKHVEIVNTDAEGRLVLADAIAMARKDYHAAAIIDLATLTGAARVAFGNCAAGLWSSSSPLHAMLRDASKETGERVWPMPLYDEYFEQIKSEVALIKNSGGRDGGASTAAAFLKTFAEKTPWAHLDIAPVSNLERGRSDLGAGATGFGTRLLIKAVEEARQGWLAAVVPNIEVRV